MNRASLFTLRKDLGQKIIILAGPRQVGKTTLARSLSPSQVYLSYDDPSHRITLRKRDWDRKVDLVIFDELHKMKQWKTFLKGVYDVEGMPPALVVTGSARLDLLRRAGDSMAGRYFSWRLHPIDVREAVTGAGVEPEEALSRILRFGGFPEPFLKAQDIFYARWRRTHHDIILKDDVWDVYRVKDLRGLETLVEMLRSRVGSPLSALSLARDLGCDAVTVRRWLHALELLHVIFFVRPWHRNVARAILKEPKCYFYDTAQVEGEGPRLENLVACALQKEVHRLEDELGRDGQLCYVRTRDGREIDFAVIGKTKVKLLVEVKTGDATPSPAFSQLGKFFPGAAALQLVRNLDRERMIPEGPEIRRMAPYLAGLDLSGFLP